MRLPYAKYGDKFTKQSQVRFNGYNHSLYARDGDIFDMQNMSSDQFPLLTPRNERKVYQTATSWTIFDSSDFEFGPEKRFLYVSLTDGVAGSIMKELDKVTLKFEDGSAFADNAGTYIVKSIGATVDTRYKIDFYNTEFSAVGKPDDDKKLTITVVGSVINTEVLTDDISLGNSTTEITEKNAEYEFSDDTFKIISYSDFINTKIQTLTIQTSKQKLLGYGDNAYQSSVTWRIKSSENNIVHLRSSNRNGSTTIMNAFNSDLVSIKFYNGNTSYTMEVSGDIRRVDNYEVALHNLFGTTIPPVGDDAFDIEVYNAILGPKNSQTQSLEVTYSENNSSSSRYVLFYGPDGWEFQTTTRTYSDFTYKHECSKTTTTYSYGKSASILVDSIGSGDCLYWVTPDGYFFYDNILRGKLTEGEKTFTETGVFIWIMPDMAYYNKATGKIVENTAYTQSQRLYSTGSYKLYVDSSYIEIDKSLPDWKDMKEKYQKDDTIKITIRDTDYKKYEYSVSITEIDTVGDYGRISFAEGTVQTIYPYKILRLSIALDIPDLRFVCAANNRIWGCNEDTIFCSVFGDPFRWFNYSASDSGNVGDIAWSITPFVTGSFTGCVSYRDTPLFFMEDKIIAVNGTKASNFELSIDNAPGVLSGAEKSIVISNDNIYYLSRDGIIRYYSYTPINISENFYERFKGGCGGATNSKVYMSLWNDNGEKLFAYDINKKIWSVEDDFKSKSFTYFNGDLLGVSKDNVLYIMNSQEDEKEGIESFVEFGDYYCQSPDKKVISKLFIRLSIDEGASVLVSLNYDSQKDDSGKRVWHSTKVLKSTSKKSFVLPIVPKRCDHFRIKISGQGGYVIYGLTHEYYNGTF